MTTEATHQITIYRSDLIDAMIENEKAKDETSHWCAIRIRPDGSMYCTQEVSQCYGEDEYYHRMPHTVTVNASMGHGQCNLPEDWSDDDGVLADLIPSIVEQLEDAGYEVTVE